MRLAEGVQATPELEVLLSCARRHVADPGAQRIRELVTGPFDWRELARLAQRHKLRPLVFRNLQAVCPESLSRSSFADALRDYRDYRARNRSLTRELQQVFSLLEGNDVATVPFKGPTLGSLAYGDPDLRQFADLDILIQPRDIPRARELLLSLGYRPRGRQEPALRQSRSWYEYSLVRPGVLLELHWSYGIRCVSLPRDPSAVRGRAKPVCVEKASIPTLCPEDAVVMLCAQGFKSHWDRLKFVVDLAELMRTHSELDWHLVLEESSDLRRMLYLGLSLARDLGGATIPQEIDRLIQADALVPRLAREAQRWMFRPRGARMLPAQHLFFQLGVRKQTRQRVAYLLEPNLEDRHSLRLPPALDFLYVLYRPLRLSWKYLRLLFVTRTAAGQRRFVPGCQLRHRTTRATYGPIASTQLQEAWSNLSPAVESSKMERSTIGAERFESLVSRLHDAEFERQDEVRRLLSDEYLRRIQKQLPERKPSKPFLLGVIGLIGSGKTTTLRYVSRRVAGSIMVRTDAARFLLKEYDIADEDNWSKYAPIANDIAFNVQKCLLASGYTVLFDRDFVEESKRERAQRYADAAGVPFYLIRIDLNEDLSLQRLATEWKRIETGERKQDFDHYLVVTRGKEGAVHRRGKFHEDLDSRNVTQLIGRLDNSVDRGTLEAQIDRVLAPVLPA